MDDWLTPSFKHSKLENPSFADLVDIFEDAWVHYIFKPVAALLAMPHGDIAAMSVLSSYFEAIESLYRGESSNLRSKEFFVAGFCRIFKARDTGIRKAAEAAYKHIRCGLSHEGMLSYKVQYARGAKNAFVLTYPKLSDGTLNTEAEVTSIIVNPHKFYEGAQRHFAGPD